MLVQIMALGPNVGLPGGDIGDIGDNLVDFFYN